MTVRKEGLHNITTSNKRKIRIKEGKGYGYSENRRKRGTL